MACVRQREPHLLRAAIRRGLAHTSIAPPWIPWPDLGELDLGARHHGLVPTIEVETLDPMRGVAREPAARSHA